MLEFIKSKLLLIVLFIFYFVIIELLTFQTLNLGIFPKYLILDISLILIIASFIFLMKTNKVSFIYLSICLFACIILYLTNSIIYFIFGDIFSLEKLFLIGEANEVFEVAFLNKQVIIISLLLFFSYLIINCLLLKNLKYYKITFPKRLSIFSGFLVLFMSSYLICSVKAKNNIFIRDVKINEHLFVSTLKKNAFQHYGVLTFYVKEAESYINLDYGNVEISDKQNKTPYFGLLKDKNVITIMIESGQEFGVNPVLTPNLYRLKTEGLYFAENYSINKTNVSEQIGIVGNYPTTAYLYYDKNYDFQFSVPNVLKGKYITSYFHDNNEDFYSRGTLLSQMGFDKLYFHDDLFPEALPNWDGSWSWGGDYTLDSITIERILPYLIYEDQLFYSFWTTLSTHGPYSNNHYSNRNLFINKGYFRLIEEAEEKGLWENPLKGDPNDGEFQIKYYQAAMIDLDIAIGKIIDELTKKNLLNDTVIILFSDHHVYYHELHLRLNNLGEKELYKANQLYDTILYIWNPTLTEKYLSENNTNTITTFTSPYIIVPTLLDLLGVEYKSDWYSNLSIFDEDYLPVFYSHQHQAFMDNYLYTIDIKNVIFQDKELSQTEIENFIINCILLLKRQETINSLYS